MQARVLFHLSASIAGLGIFSALLNLANPSMLGLSLVGAACAAAPGLFLGLWIRAHSASAILRRMSQASLRSTGTTVTATTGGAHSHSIAGITNPGITNSGITNSGITKAHMMKADIAKASITKVR